MSTERKEEELCDVPMMSSDFGVVLARCGREKTHDGHHEGWSVFGNPTLLMWGPKATVPREGDDSK